MADIVSDDPELAGHVERLEAQADEQDPDEDCPWPTCLPSSSWQRSSSSCVTIRWQLVSGATGLDDFEWGVTLLADDLADLKEIVYEMRFDV